MKTVNPSWFPRFLLLALIGIIGTAHAALQGYTEEEVIPNTHLSSAALAKVRTQTKDPVWISAEIDASASAAHTLTASYMVKPNKPNLKLVNIYVKLQSSIADRPAESGTVWDSYGLDKATSDAVEGALNDSKFSAAATKGVATVAIVVNYIDANGASKEFAIPPFQKPFAW